MLECLTESVAAAYMTEAQSMTSSSLCLATSGEERSVRGNIVEGGGHKTRDSSTIILSESEN